MAARPLPRDATEGLVRLAASGPLAGDPDRLAVALADGTLPLLADEVPGEGDLRRFAVDLRLQVGGPGSGRTTFGKAAYLDLGRPVRVDSGWEVELGWRASTAAPLFPVFSGRLAIAWGGLDEPPARARHRRPALGPVGRDPGLQRPGADREGHRPGAERPGADAGLPGRP